MTVEDDRGTNGFAVPVAPFIVGAGIGMGQDTHQSVKCCVQY